MKRKLIALYLITIFLALPIFAVLAQTPDRMEGVTLDSILRGITNAAWQIFGAIAVICFIVAGILFLTAAGNPEKIVIARTAFLWGVAGAIVGLIAFSMLTLIGGIIQG